MSPLHSSLTSISAPAMAAWETTIDALSADDLRNIFAFVPSFDRRVPLTGSRSRTHAAILPCPLRSAQHLNPPASSDRPHPSRVPNPCGTTHSDVERSFVFLQGAQRVDAAVTHTQCDLPHHTQCCCVSHPPVMALLGGSSDSAKPVSAYGVLVCIRRDAVPVVCKTWLDICRNTPGLWHGVEVDGGTTLERHGLPLTWARALPWLLARTQMRSLTIRCRPDSPSNRLPPISLRPLALICKRNRNSTGWRHRIIMYCAISYSGGRGAGSMQISAIPRCNLSHFGQSQIKLDI